jgi:acyl dehydratase
MVSPPEKDTAMSPDTAVAPLATGNGTSASQEGFLCIRETIHVSPDRVRDFLNGCPDESPLHHCDEYARSLGFNGRIVPGAFLVSTVSGLLGTELHCVVLGMALEFRHAIYSEDVIEVVVTSHDPAGKLRRRIMVTCTVEEVVVSEGTGTILDPFARKKR